MPKVLVSSSCGVRHVGVAPTVLIVEDAVRVLRVHAKEWINFSRYYPPTTDMPSVYGAGLGEGVR